MFREKKVLNFLKLSNSKTQLTLGFFWLLRINNSSWGKKARHRKLNKKEMIGLGPGRGAQVTESADNEHGLFPRENSTYQLFPLDRS